MSFSAYRAYSQAVTKPRTKHGTDVKFPFVFAKNGRTGRIKKWGGQKFGTYFVFAGQPKRNSFATFRAAYEYLDREFSRLDTDRVNALSLNALNGDVRTYSELEELLHQGGGARLREAVAYFLANHKSKRLEPKTVTRCVAAFLGAQRTKNVSGIQLKTLVKHYRRFEWDFGARQIHEITALEIETWLGSRNDENDGAPWNAKTRIGVRGSLVSLSRYAQGVLKAIPDHGKTEFQQVRITKGEEKSEVEIYTPDEFKFLLLAAVQYDVTLIPAMVVGGFAGLRPFEFHAEGLKRDPLKWEAFNWADKSLHVRGQKIWSKGTRDIPLQPAVEAWLEPFKGLTGPIWRFQQAHSKKWVALRKATGVRSIYDGFRHSYATPQRLQAQRGYTIRTQPWPTIVRFYAGLVAHGLPFAPMLRLAETLAASPSAAELLAATSMQGLLLSDHADFLSTDSTLRVSYVSSVQQFRFQHSTFSGHDDQRTCPESEGVVTLSLFLRYKYGVLFTTAAA